MTEDIQTTQPVVCLERGGRHILRSISTTWLGAAGIRFTNMHPHDFAKARSIDAIIALCGVLMAASPALADVIEIGPQGQVTVYSAPAVFTADGVQAIAPPAARRSSAAASEQVNGMIAEAASRYALSPTLVKAVAWRESRFQQGAVSSKGAVGVMQLMPSAARQLGVDPYDMRQNIHGGAAYLSQMLSRYRGDTGLALAAYNAGPAMVDRYGGAPPFKETRRYVADILGQLAPVDAPSSFLIVGQ